MSTSTDTPSAPASTSPSTKASRTTIARRYPDPDLFDPGRDSRGHLFFGFGRHMCLGQHLARLEVQVALERLLARLPTLRLAVQPADVGLIRTGWLHGIVTELPVAW